jgi:hypothetical protein
VPHSLLLRDLKRIRSSGLVRAESSTIPHVTRLVRGESTEEMGATPTFLLVKQRLEEAIGRLTPPEVGEALRVLLGLDEKTQFSSLERVRRPAAARIVGYSASYLARYKEDAYLTDLATELTVSPHRGDAPRGVGQSHVDALVSDIRDAIAAAPLDVASIAIKSGLEPILRIASDPSFVRRDFSYHAVIEWLKIGEQFFYIVEGTYSSVRRFHVSPDEAIVVFARTAEALDAAFVDRSCISAEYCNIDSESWHRLAETYFSSEVRVDGRLFVASLVELSDDTACFSVKGLPAPPDAVSVVFKNTYLVPHTTRLFPIKLSRHFCIGTASMEVRLIDRKVSRLEAFVYLAGLSESDIDLYSNTESVDRRAVRGAGQQRVLGVRSRPDALIWPGSGVDFVWERSQ